MILVDVHAHLELCGDLNAVIERAKAAGVKKIVAQGVNPLTNRNVLKLAEKYDIVEPALGIYPWDALQKETKDDPDDHPFKTKELDFEAELKFIEESKPMALGEIGLDYKDGEDKVMQKAHFTSFIELGKKLDIPLIIHSRKAEQDVIDLLEEHKATKVILHCFSGKHKLVKRAVELKYNFSIPTNVVKSQHFQAVINLVPLSQLLTETDSPYLSPFSDKPNEPAFVIESLKKIAEIKEITLEDAANNIFMNYQRLF